MLDDEFTPEEREAATVRAIIVIAGESAVYAMLPAAEKLALIINGLKTIEDSVEEAKNPETIAAIDEFILAAGTLTKTELIGALYYSMPTLARNMAEADDY